MPAIRRQVFIAAPPRAVWRALTTTEGLQRWLCDDARVEPRVGGRYILIHFDDENIEERGMIHKWRPTSHLEITWDRVGTQPSAGTQITWKLARAGKETRLAMVHSGSVFDDEEQRALTDRDWRRALSALQSELDQD